MIVPDWLAFWGVVAYAIWMALAIIWASVLLSVWRRSRHAIWLLAVVACVLTAARFGLLAVSLGPLVLVALGMLAAALGAGLVVAANLGVNLLAAAFERLPQLLAPIIDQATATINLISSTLTGVTAAVTAIAAGDWSAAWEALKGIVDGVITYVTDSWTNFTTMFGELGDLFAGIVPPGWFEALTGWEWPKFEPPALLTSLLAWKWPGFPALPSILDALVTWKWPSLEMPDWLDSLLNFKWPGFPALPDWLAAALGVSSEPEKPPAKNEQLGTSYYTGGPTWVGEAGRELLIPPRGSQIIPNRTAEKLGRRGGSGRRDGATDDRARRQRHLRAGVSGCRHSGERIGNNDCKRNTRHSKRWHSGRSG